MAKKKSGGGTWLAVVAGLFIAAHAHPVKGHGAAVADALAGTLAVAGAKGLSSGYSTQSFAVTFLHDAHLPETACDQSAMRGWQDAEGTYARFRNPLDTTLREPGSWSVNSAGVEEYPSWGWGLKADVDTLYNGDYSAIISALRQGDSAQAVADAVASSPWGTGPFSAAC